MTHARTPQPPRQVPTLTEVVDVGKPKPAAGAVTPEVAVVVPGPAAPAAAVPPAGALLSPAGVTPPPFNEDLLVQRVLFDVQRQVDLMLEHRLRETLAPALARLTESLVREVHNDLASTLRDVVAKAVAQEIARLRAR